VIYSFGRDKHYYKRYNKFKSKLVKSVGFYFYGLVTREVLLGDVEEITDEEDEGNGEIFVEEKKT
jgi:hypothetical protein